MRATTPPVVGRPSVTSHADIERAAFGLFAQRGFEATTLEMIATEVGVGRRTLFRYFASKNDIPWGQFDQTLVGFRAELEAQPDDLPVRVAVGRAVVAFNDFSDEAAPPHATRMRLILETPALQAHAALRYAQWRGVIADVVAGRLGERPDSLTPQLVGHLALAQALTAYDQWLRQGDHRVISLLDHLGRTLAATDGLHHG